MSRDPFRGPKLPRTLLDQVQGGGAHGGRREVSRKDRRKAERQQKRQPQRPRPVSAPRARAPTRTQDLDREDDGDRSEAFEADESPEPETARRKTTVESQPLKSILKKQVAPAPANAEQEEQGFSDASEASDASGFVVSTRAAKVGLADDDAEIAALEKKLGLKGNKRSKDVTDEELDWLLTGSGGDSDSDGVSRKRKRPDDAKWLKDKRRKATAAPQEVDEDVSPSSEDTTDQEDIANPFSEDELDSDDFGELGSGDDDDDNDDDIAEASRPAAKPRENPYVAPVTKEATPAKYVPPSMRKAATPDEEALKQLRRQIQGQLNRLSEANMMSIVQAIEDIYASNARQLVTSTVIDLLTGMINNPATLNDAFLMLHAAFSTALYKVTGTDFGAQLLERLTECYEEHRVDVDTKHSLNILAFLSCLYNCQMTGSVIIFDYVRSLLEELSEKNTELLLRVIRTCGQQLRQDDPSSLKDIVLLLQRSVADVGEENLSVRTKFMIETINNLKNNRLKGGAAASAVVAEHTARTKKVMSTLNSRAKANEPLRISLADIRDSDKKGKWWLVGASYHDPAKMANGGTTAVKVSRPLHDDDGYESETPGHVNLSKLARQQGMNTDVRRAIFVSILSAADYIDAHMRLLKLRLKVKQQVEIPRVLVHCVGSESVYNPYYALIARKFCGEHRLRKAFSFALWDLIKQMDEVPDDDDGDAASSGWGLRKVVNLAKFYGTLVEQGDLDIAMLKKLDFAYLSANASMFVEALITTIFTQARRSTDGLEARVREVFGKARRSPAMIQGLAYFLETTVSKAELERRKKDANAVRDGCEIARDVLAEAAKDAPAEEDDGSDEDDAEDD